MLTRDPICQMCRCAPSTVADHYPTKRRDLIVQGLDPDDPTYGRGLCTRCHNVHTAAESPAGWRDFL